MRLGTRRVNGIVSGHGATNAAITFVFRRKNGGHVQIPGRSLVGRPLVLHRSSVSLFCASFDSSLTRSLLARVLADLLCGRPLLIELLWRRGFAAAGALAKPLSCNSLDRARATEGFSILPTSVEEFRRLFFLQGDVPALPCRCFALWRQWPRSCLLYSGRERFKRSGIFLQNEEDGNHECIKCAEEMMRKRRQRLATRSTFENSDGYINPSDILLI